MNHMVEKFVKTAGMYVGKKANGKMPPAVQLDRILDKIQRITNLDITEAEKKEGLDILWDMYAKVQKPLSKSNYTEDESWGNAKKDQETGWWGREYNTEVNQTTYGEAFTDVIDSAQMPSPTTKVVRYDDD